MMEEYILLMDQADTEPYELTMYNASTAAEEKQ